MPVIGLRAFDPYKPTSVANADSYSPPDMATPISAHAANSETASCADPSAISPTANNRLVVISTGRPPRRSMSRPAQGPSNAVTTSASENAANTDGTPIPRSVAIDAASTAGR